jgi:HSP20 family protein
MSLVSWDPFEPLNVQREVTPLREMLNRLVEESVVGPARLEGVRRAFPLDVRETDHEYIVEAALPGVKPEQLQIAATQDTLSIRTTTSAEQKAEQKPGVYVRRERYMGEMMRIIGLPTPIDPEKVNATYEDGVLTLTLPKAAHAKPKQIPVHVKEPPSGR